MRAIRKLPPGVTIHAIEGATPLGTQRELAGELIVEMPDGSMHRITGAEMTEWNEALSGFIKRWRLAED